MSRRRSRAQIGWDQVPTTSEEWAQVEPVLSLTVEIFDEGEVEHIKLLQALWNASFSKDEKVFKVKGDSASPKWREIGFQGDNPCTDFRGAGRTGCEVILYLMENHSDLVKRIRSKLDLFAASTLSNLQTLVVQLRLYPADLAEGAIFDPSSAGTEMRKKGSGWSKKSTFLASSSTSPEVTLAAMKGFAKLSVSLDSQSPYPGLVLLFELSRLLWELILVVWETSDDGGTPDEAMRLKRLMGFSVALATSRQVLMTTLATQPSSLELLVSKSVSYLVENGGKPNKKSMTCLPVPRKMKSVLPMGKPSRKQTGRSSLPKDLQVVVNVDK